MVPQGLPESQLIRGRNTASRLLPETAADDSWMERSSNERTRLLAVLVVGFIAWAASKGGQESLLDYAACVWIIIPALLPTWSWLRKPSDFGIPIYPVYSATFVWTYAMPLLDHHPMLRLYEPDLRAEAAFWVGAYLYLGYFCWIRFSRRPCPRPVFQRILWLSNREGMFFIFLVIGTVYELMARAGALDILGGMAPVIRAASAGLVTVAVLGLSIRMGRGNWPILFKIGFVATLTTYMLASAIGLLLVGAMITIGTAIVGYFLGRMRVPWIPIAVSLALLTVLHLGKEGMRREHWEVGEAWLVQPSEYFGLYEEWIGRGLTRLEEENTFEEESWQSSRSLLGRASLIHMFLVTYSQSPDQVPFLQGATYRVVPSILVPRFLDPDKPASHEGTYLLNIEYGLQDRESTASTTIGWGLMNESYANFGLAGMAVLIVFLTWAFSAVERASRYSPFYSFRAFLAFLFCVYALNTEATMGVFLSVALQGIVGILVTIPLMRLTNDQAMLRPLLASGPARNE